MPTIAVDIDDTLYSFGQLAREMFVTVALEREDKDLQRAAYCSWNEWRSPVDIVGLDVWLEIIDRCHSDDKIVRQRPFPNAAKTLHELAEQGYDLLYISNRKPEALDATGEWLEDFGFPPGGLVCTTQPKMPFVKHCQYIIDDRARTLVEFVYDYNWKNTWGSQNAEKTRMGFGLLGEYNRSLTDIPGVWLAPNWDLLRRYLIDKGVLNGDRQPAA